jgi:hypothetical protein
MGYGANRKTSSTEPQRQAKGPVYEEKKLIPEGVAVKPISLNSFSRLSWQSPFKYLGTL